MDVTEDVTTLDNKKIVNTPRPSGPRFREIAIIVSAENATAGKVYIIRVVNFGGRCF